MKRPIITLLLIFSLFATLAKASSGIWRSHLAYTSVTDVAETPSKVFGLSDGSLFSYNKTNQAIVVYSKVNGLSDNKVSLISYSPDNNVLVIVYDNSNIDLMYENGSIINIPEIKDNNLTLNKKIFSVNYSGDKAYFATAYGVSVLNLTRKEVSASYLLKKKVYATAILSGAIYAATDQGIASVSQTDNLYNSSNWILINTLKANDLTVFQNTLLAVVSGSGLYTVTPSAYQLVKSSTVFTNLFVANNILVVYGKTQLSYYTSLAQETAVSGTNFYKLAALNPAVTTWHASSTTGINKIDKSGASYSKVTLNIKPVGPFANSPYKLRFSGEKLMIVGGGAWDDRYNTPGLMMFFENESWTNFRVDTIKAEGSSARDFLDIVEDPLLKNHYFVASFGEGVYEFKDNKFIKLHDHTGTGIETLIHPLIPKGTNHFDRTDGLFFDNDGNLFVSNHGVPKAIKCLKKDGSWTGFSYSPIANSAGITSITQSKNGLHWIVNSRYGSGIFVLNQKNTLTDESDDQYRYITTFIYSDESGLKSITPEYYFCMAEDKVGEIWLGTNVGILVFRNTENIFNSNYIGSRIKLQSSISSQESTYLLEGENVRAICADADNRKWIGTEMNGVYLVSANGKQILYHFTEENSPLPSNRILSLAIHPTTGEIFIGTDKGLSSYRNDALSTQKIFSEVYAFPNPVKPEYSGLITISGLKADVSVRIANQSGDNVYEGVVSGTQLEWNGKDATGKRVPTGIYTVYASTSETLEELVTKIVVVR